MDKPSPKPVDIAAEKARLFDLLLKKKGIRLPQSLELRRRPEAASNELSFAQQRMWFINQLEPASWAYNLTSTIRLAGRLDVAHLKRSLNEIIRRHESLRTTFRVVKGQPVQVIAQAQEVSFRNIDLSEMAPAEIEPEALRLTTEEARQPFNLSAGPLMRVTLMCLHEEQHKLLVVMHHIISDGWSTGVFFRELAALYRAYSQGQPSPLAELPVQYADFAWWQREWLQGEVLGAQLAYWKEQLAEAPSVLELPADYPRPAVRTYHGATHGFVLRADVTRRLKALSRQEDGTLFTLLLAAFKALLHKYTRQQDLVVGSPVANRNRVEIEGLIGFFVNTLVLRTRWEGDPSFRELFGRVREVFLGAYTHQDLPFEKLVEELEPERDMSHTPLFQVLFVLQNIPHEELKIEGLKFSTQKTESGTAKFDLLLEMAEDAENLRGTFEYNTDLFKPETITRLTSHFQTLLDRVSAEPDRRLSELSVMSEAEERQLLRDWNATQAECSYEKNIHQLVEAQVQRTPEALAVVFEDALLTYLELDQRANQLAHYLRRLGVGPDVRVGICMERSLEMLIGVLGILKAGGAYVPLHPTYPRERLAFMIEDTNALLILTQKHLAGVLPDVDARKIYLDANWSEIAVISRQTPEPMAQADNLAYITYTSGSTGKPKGIAMPQRALLNLLEWQYRYTRMAEGARTLQFASLSFDVSFQDIFSTWCSGGTLVLIREEVRSNIAGLARVLIEERINRIFIPAVALQQLAEGFRTEDYAACSLQRVIAGSDQLHITQAINRMFTGLKDCSLHNEYGPSEAHVVTALDMPRALEAWASRPSVGRPISNVSIYLLDHHWRPVPIGVAGELYIGGVCLARGYMRRPDLTAERFVPDPFSVTPGARLYQTGDLARYLPDGNIEFLGRMDHQVKIRGFRVEPGEVESVLGLHPAVRETVVLAREDVPGDKRLVAYVVLEQGQSLSVTDARKFLLERLPDYMLPSSFMFIDALPLNSNGKFDRRALPVPDQSRPEIEAPFVAPGTALEAAIAAIYSQVLSLEQVGIHDNFFELGGHSLLATQMVARLSESFETEVPLRALFESPTVAGLSERMLAEEAQPETLEEIASLLNQLHELSEVEVEERLKKLRDEET